MNDENWKIDEIKDLDDVVGTFSSLFAEICHDGGQLGDLYTGAGSSLARHALLSETIVDSITSGILVVEATGQVRLANSAARNVLGIDANQDVSSIRLEQMLGDASELSALIGESLKNASNASRRLLSVQTRTGKRLSLGASTSCLYSTPSKAGAVIVIFAELRGKDGPENTRGAVGLGSPSAAGVPPTYLRGVLDSYDYFCSVVREVERVQAKLEKGTLVGSDVAECATSTRQVWEVMTAYALSLIARESLTELADPAASVKSALSRRKELAGVTIKGVLAGLPQVKTVRKVLEAGVELLLLGCVADASEGVEVSAVLGQGAQGDVVEITILERCRRRPLVPVGATLRDFRVDQDLRREAGLLLLRSLPSPDHAVAVSDRDGTLTFSVRFAMPINKGAGPTAPRSDSSERGPSEG